MTAPLISIPPEALTLSAGPLRALLHLASLDDATLAEGVAAAARACDVGERSLYRHAGALEGGGLLERDDAGALALPWRSAPPVTAEAVTASASTAADPVTTPHAADADEVEQLRAEVAELGRRLATAERRREEALDDIEERLEAAEGREWALEAFEQHTQRLDALESEVAALSDLAVDVSDPELEMVEEAQSPEELSGMRGRREAYKRGREKKRARRKHAASPIAPKTLTEEEAGRVRRIFHLAAAEDHVEFVQIQKLRARADVDLERLQVWLLEEARCGRATFTGTNMSALSEAQRAAAVPYKGHRCALVKLSRAA